MVCVCVLCYVCCSLSMCVVACRCGLLFAVSRYVLMLYVDCLLCVVAAVVGVHC